MPYKAAGSSVGVALDGGGGGRSPYSLGEGSWREDRHCTSSFLPTSSSLWHPFAPLKRSRRKQRTKASITRASTKLVFMKAFRTFTSVGHRSMFYFAHTNIVSRNLGNEHRAAHTALWIYIYIDIHMGYRGALYDRVIQVSMSCSMFLVYVFDSPLQVWTGPPIATPKYDLCLLPRGPT